MGQDKENPTSPVVGNTPVFSSVPQDGSQINPAPSAAPDTSTNPTETVEEMQKRMADEARYMEELRNAPDIVLQKEKKPGNKKIIFLAIFAVIVIAVCVVLSITASNIGGNKKGHVGANNNGEATDISIEDVKKEFNGFLNYLMKGKETSEDITFSDDEGNGLYFDTMLKTKADEKKDYLDKLRDKYLSFASVYGLYSDDEEFEDEVLGYYYYVGLMEEISEEEIINQMGEATDEQINDIMDKKFVTESSLSDVRKIYSDTKSHYVLFAETIVAANKVGCVNDGKVNSICARDLIEANGEKALRYIDSANDLKETLKNRAIEEIGAFYTSLYPDDIEEITL